jgi:phosphoribosylaminoimidazole-succinocarboxamide synthase
MAGMLESSIRSLPLVARGKVRDIYAVGDDQLLIITTDRLSAFDVVMPTPIPDKGRVLTGLSNFWFTKLADIVPNHLLGIDPASVVAPDEVEQVKGRAVVVRKLHPLPIEAVVRGYLEGSGWKEYEATGAICGVTLPPGLQRAEQLPQPIFTPATKAIMGEHDENIDFARVEMMISRKLAAKVRDTAIALYQRAATYALARGIIIADTKFEFGLDENEKLFLIDEALTPDSSRFWPVDTYAVGDSPESFDKQYIRNWLEMIGFNKQPPAPAIPPEVAEQTAVRYREALRRLIG